MGRARRPPRAGDLAVARLEAVAFADGGARFFQMAVIDVSERRNAENSLREREARLGAILDTVVDAVVTIDEQGIIESANASVERMFGHQPSALIGQSVAVLMPASHRPQVRYLLARYLGTGPESIVGGVREVPGQRRDGSTFPAELAVGELRSEHQRRYVGVIRDISDRRQQEQQILESLSRFRQIAARLEDIFYIAEPANGRLHYVSPAFTAIFARKIDEVEGAGSWRPWVHPEDAARVEAAFAHAAQGREFDEEYRILRPDGSERLLRDRGFPLPEENRVTGIVHDVTEERRLEEGLRLAQRLEAVGTLASGVAHDVNNLLMGLSGLANMALQALPPEHLAAGYVRRSLEATMRGAALTRQLLMFSGQRRAPAAPVELDAAVTATQHLLERLVGEHIRLSIETHAPGLGVLAEPGEIEQILLNLVTNARDAMPDGGELHVETGARDDDVVVLSVRDTGKGMDAATRARAFEPFFTTKAAGQGTGLGLATILAVAKQRRGEVRVDSEPGRGTTVAVQLPVVARDLRQGGGADVATPHGSEVVLAVEDDALVRDTVERYLVTLGYQPLIATDPQTALQLAQDEPRIDLLLTDVVMPGRFGGELAQEIGELRPGVRVLFMSAHPRSDLLRLGRIRPDSQLLSKPFGQHELAVSLRAALDERSPPGDGADPHRHPVLIVDDDEDVALALQEAVELAGWPAATAHSGVRAIELARSLRPELVLCDLGLGHGMSGYDVARALRAEKDLGGAALVAVTGRSVEDCRAEASAAGFDAVLTKPVDFAALEELVRRPPRRPSFRVDDDRGAASQAP